MQPLEPLNITYAQLRTAGGSSSVQDVIEDDDDDEEQQQQQPETMYFLRNHIKTTRYQSIVLIGFGAFLVFVASFCAIGILYLVMYLVVPVSVAAQAYVFFRWRHLQIRGTHVAPLRRFDASIQYWGESLYSRLYSGSGTATAGTAAAAAAPYAYASSSSSSSRAS